jgi:triacylglycerol lipase
MHAHVLSPSTNHFRASEPDMRNNVGVSTRRLGAKLRQPPTRLNLSPQDMPTRPPNSQQPPHKPPHPVLRWVGQNDPFPTPDSPQSSGSRPISPSASHMQNLQDALTSPLPIPSTSTLKLPPRAVPPSIPLSDSPLFLRSLTRVTLPTASVSSLAPAAHPFEPPEDPNSPGAPIFLQHSPPERLSLDNLRSLRDRNGGSSARPPKHSSRASSALFSTSAAPSWWWFQNGNKENIDRLLSDEDRAPTIEEEQSRIHKKCSQHSSSFPVCYSVVSI